MDILFIANNTYWCAYR